jgi:hypothetical protein
VQDCATVSLTCKNPQGRPDDHSTPLFTTADACCKAKLNWIKSEICVVASESGIDPTDGDSPGAGAWRKNNAWSYCVLGESLIRSVLRSASNYCSIFSQLTFYLCLSFYT